jgi:KEOPS complex subunit Pcc1
MREIDGDRSRASVERVGPTVTLSVTAADLVALRAGLNTWQGLVGVAEATAAAAAGE